MARPVDPAAQCVCGHAHEAHEHFRQGTDCSLCACIRFRMDKRQVPAPR